MKLQICAEVEGLFLLENRVEANLYPYEFSLFLKDGKRYISVTKPVEDFIKYAPKMYVKDGVPNIEATNPEIYKDMEEWLYYIEAMGAFNFEVSKIYINELEVNWIYEKDDEKGQIPIISHRRNRVERKAKKYVTNSNLSNLVIFRRMLPDAHIPFSYYRQAKAFFDDGNFYFAFINYFMMLEFCFANGKFQKRDVINNFQKSILLKLCILNTIYLIKSNDQGGNYAWLVSECKSKHKKLDFEGIVYILVEYRGLLSHASERSKKFLFDDLKLRPLAFITSMVCFSLCGYMQVYSCSDDEVKNRMMLEQIDNLEKKI